eukprot:186394-Amphidinium_carterae.1
MKKSCICVFACARFATANWYMPIASALSYSKAIPAILQHSVDYRNHQPQMSMSTKNPLVLLHHRNVHPRRLGFD